MVLLRRIRNHNTRYLLDLDILNNGMIALRRTYQNHPIHMIALQNLHLLRKIFQLACDNSKIFRCRCTLDRMNHLIVVRI